MPAASVQEAVEAAAQLGGRVLLKAEAGGLVPSAGAAGTRIDLRSAEEVAEGYRAESAGTAARWCGCAAAREVSAAVSALAAPSRTHPDAQAEQLTWIRW